MRTRSTVSGLAVLGPNVATPSSGSPPNFESTCVCTLERRRWPVPPVETTLPPGQRWGNTWKLLPIITQATAHFLRKGLSPTDGNFPCEECGKDFNSAQLVRDHVRVHLRNHQCDQCSIAMPTPSTLRTHIRYVHLKERLQSCTLCNYKGKTTADIRSHMKTHDRNRAKVICKYNCGFSKMSKKAVQVHYENRHGHKRNIFGCHKCDEANFSEGTQVTKHLQRVHGVPKVGLVRQQFKKGINGIFYMSQEDVWYEAWTKTDGDNKS